MRRLLWGLLGFTIIFIVANAVAVSLRDRTRFLLESDLFVWRHKIDYFNSGLESETLILGDSQAMSGILPVALDESVYNMGLPSQQPLGIKVLVESVATRPMIRTVIINVSPFTIYKSEVVQSFLSYYKQTFRPSRAEMALDPVDNARHPGDVAYRYLRLLPLFELRDRLTPIIASKDGLALAQSRRSENEITEKTLTEYSGFWIWKSNGNFECNQKQMPPPTAGVISYAENPGAIATLVDALKILRKSQKRVILVSIPLSKEWAALAAPDTESRFAKALNQIASDSGAELLPEINRDQYVGLFQDWTHLNLCGAKKYTEWLGNQLRKDQDSQ